MADKTPPYIPEDYLPLEEETALRSQVVRTNSLFCQSLLREMSENSLILLPKATSEKDLAKSDYFSSESKENSNVTPDSLFKLIRRCSGMKTSVSGNMFNDQIVKIPSHVPTDISSKETSNKTAPELPMERFCSTNRDISAKEVEVLSSQVPSKESSLKRSRNLSSEGESEDSFEKRARVSAEEIGTGGQEKEMFPVSPVMSPITQDMPPEAPSGGTMTETNVECGVSPNEDKSEGQVAEEDVEKSEANMTSEESMDVPTAESGKMSQSSSVPDQQQVSIAEERSSEGDRCSICGKRNCPADPKLRSKISQMPMPLKSLVGKPKSPRKSKFSQVNVMKVKKTKTPFKHCIYTRSLTNRLAKRIANHTPLHVFKLKVT